MKFSCLSSGSKANCTFVWTSKAAFLVDVGLSTRQVEQRLLKIGMKPQDLTAILVTHEHSDHISGLAAFSRKHRVPVYANQGTAPFVRQSYHVEIFDSQCDFEIDGVSIKPVPVQHDAQEPVGFVFSDGGVQLGVVTDLGRVTPAIRGALKAVNGLVLESNHDQELLQTCAYPWHLKKRITSTHGHLSNDSAASFLGAIAGPHLSHIVLAHLSENSNTPQHALRTAAGHLQEWGGRICCASVSAPTELVDLAQDFSENCRNKSDFTDVSEAWSAIAV